MSERDRNLSLECAIFIPPVIWENVWFRDVDSEFKKRMDRYLAKLEEFALAEKRSYKRFREFLDKNSDLMREKYSLVQSMSDSEIDYVLNRKLEELQKIHRLH